MFKILKSEACIFFVVPECNISSNISTIYSVCSDIVKSKVGGVNRWK